LPGYRTTPPTETPSSFSDVTTHITLTTLASSAAADQVIHAVDDIYDVHPIDHVSDVFPVNDVDHVEHVDDITDIDLPQYDRSRAWLFEPIIEIENSNAE